MSGRITKYELRTPRELETISKPAKTFFYNKKNVFREQFEFDL